MAAPRVVDIRCLPHSRVRSRVQERARIRQEQARVLKVGCVTRIGIDDQLRIGMCCERMNELMVGIMMSLFRLRPVSAG